MTGLINNWRDFTQRLTPLFAAALLAAGCMTPFDLVCAADAPARGRFLVATRDLRESTFFETVVLLVQHDDAGTMGLVINKPSAFGIDSFLPDDDTLARFDKKIYIGGPVATYGVILLVRSASVPPDAEHVFGDVYASGSRDLLVDVISDADAGSKLRLYAGHAGWSPGQLDYEIERGSWQVAPASETMIFSDAPETVWKKLEPGPRALIVRVD